MGQIEQTIAQRGGKILESYSLFDIYEGSQIKEGYTCTEEEVNSYCRKKSFGKCAYDLAMGAFPGEFFDLLGLYKIPANEVMLKPHLLKEAYVKAKARDK